MDEHQPISLRDLVTGVRDDFFQWDRGLIGTFTALCWRPDKVARAYVFQRDGGYTPPWRYLLIGVFAYAAASWFALHQTNHTDLVYTNNRVTAFLLDNAALLTLLTLPLFAVLMRLFFVGLNIRFVDALVVLFYTQGHVNLLSVASVALPVITGVDAAGGVINLLLLLYFIWACAAFPEGPWWRRLVASTLTLIAGQLINGGIVYLISRFA